MKIFVAHRRTSEKNLLKKFGPTARIIDVTSRADEPWVRFSPFWPHGEIPVPFSGDTTATCVEGIWQALKVFESEDVDRSKLDVPNMKGIKRTVRRLGLVRGHRRGLTGTELLAYREARIQIYLPTYRWVLENCLKEELQQLRSLTDKTDVVLLDYTVNGDIDDLSKPLSHAALIQRYLEKNWQDETGNRLA